MVALEHLQQRKERKALRGKSIKFMVNVIVMIISYACFNCICNSDLSLTKVVSLPTVVIGVTPLLMLSWCFANVINVLGLNKKK